MTQLSLGEFITVTIGDQSMTDWSSIVTLINSRKVVTDKICSRCSHFSEHQKLSNFPLLVFLRSFYESTGTELSVYDMIFKLKWSSCNFFA